MPHEKLAQYGYKIVRPIKENVRFASYLVQRDGLESFAKVAVGDHAREIQNEVWYALTLNRAGETTSVLTVRAPKMEAFGEGWYVCESLAESPLIAHENACTAHEVAESAEELSRILAGLDRAFTDTPLFEAIVEESESAPVTDILRRVDRWVSLPLEEGLITAERVAQAKACIGAGVTGLRPRLQHGDFVPWHVFRTGRRTYAVVDGEHASLLKPRFYDLAYLYARIWTRMHAPGIARAVVRSFLAAAEIEYAQFTAQFLTILTQRAIGMHLDALNDRQTNDYIAEAQALLTNCLGQDIDELIYSLR